ncbi:ARM repeat-containing protein [Amylocystis lapponica]|nr:ARM repeat-containing protein [Amylocystis lapponica]
MQLRLDEIVAKITICVETKNWLVLTTWDGMLQCWLLMHYPIPKTTRAKLVRLYYELSLVPGVEPRVTRSWADILSRLLSSKSESRRKLEATDLQLSWRPLWRALQKELWPKRRLQESSRNVVNILLYVAEQCRRYFPANEIPDMLATFLPLLTKDSVLTIVPVMTSFLPPTHTHLYLPTLFKLWEAFNSSVVDERLIELCGELAEEHVAGKQGDAGDEGGAEWRDVGIWSESEWTVLAGKALTSMNVPVGANRGASTTAFHADNMGDRQSLRIKKPINRYNALAKLLVYSMCLDGPIRADHGNGNHRQNGHFATTQTGFLAGSRALDSLDKLITSTETFFHPSNSGPWTLSLSHFLYRITAEFCKRWKEEQQRTCKTPITRRLTPDIRRAFVTVLRNPALLAMFSKDPFSMSFAQGALRAMAYIEPNLVMPELLERAYSGLEIVNETHRTTAVMTMLSGVALPLVSERLWLGGQKHVVPLLELCIPGIDLNDPVKTLCATMFITTLVQHIKIGDVSAQQAGMPLVDDAPIEGFMEVDDTGESRLPDGVEAGSMPVLSRSEERALARDSTAGFADWVTLLFRRVFALFENLPEEGGKKNTTGGKVEESVLKAIKSMLDVVCQHLSDTLFDLVLKLVFDYGTTNAKSNAVRAFGQLVSCLAHVKPEKTIDRFLPFCMAQIQEELKHGASNIRTTSTHAAAPSDTTLHWNMSILRGCFGFGGVALVKYRTQIIELASLLIDKTKSERGYSGTGRLVNRIMHTMSTVYPVNARFVNGDVWDDPAFDQNHISQWGKFYEPETVKIEWHVQSREEIDFILELLDQIASPALDKIETLLETAGKWDGVARNDFCRYLHVVRSVWSGLPTLFQEGKKEVVNPCINDDVELAELLVTSLDVKAGFALSDPTDPRYQKAVAHRKRFGDVIHHASIALRQQHEGEDHIDAVISVSKAIDVFLLEYAMTRAVFDSLRKAYTSARDATRMSPKQKDNARMVFVKRAHVYHAGRVYMHALYRRRSQLDDELLHDLIEMSVSSYTRVRRHAQAVLHNACGYFVRSTRFSLPYMFKSLAKGTDPDRMKGALYVLWNKGTAAYALADMNFHGKYLLSLLDCQHQEKARPSIQKLVGNLAGDALAYLTEESTHTDAYTEETPGVDNALAVLKQDFALSPEDHKLLLRAVDKSRVRVLRKNDRYSETITGILEIVSKPTTHWRYVQIAAKFLYGLLRRDFEPTPEVASFFLRHSISPHPTIRSTAQKGVVKLCCHIKIRTFSKSSEELWLDEWSNPLRTNISTSSPSQLQQILDPLVPTQGDTGELYVDKINTGFAVWTPTIKAYRAVPEGSSAFTWESSSQPALRAMSSILQEEKFFSDLVGLWGQESSRNQVTPELRPDNVNFIKTLAKMFEHERLDTILSEVDPLITDIDRYKQRAGAEMLAGLLRGSKHWPKQWKDRLTSWTVERLQRIYAQMKPDTAAFWESLFTEQLIDRDPRRAKPIVDWVLSLPLEFHSDSAFAMSKTLSLFNVVVDAFGPRFLPLCDKYMHIFFDNADTGYAEIRSQIAQNICVIIGLQWRPVYPSVDAFLIACRDSSDPLHIRDAKYIDRTVELAEQLPKWKEERLPPPRVSQSQYDKVGLTMLQWIWDCSHGPQATLVFPYIIALLPEVLRMSDLNDSSELQRYSSAVLYVLSAVAPPREFVGVIMDIFISAIKSTTSWRIRVNALPTLIVFFYRNLMGMSSGAISKLMDVLLECLSDENVEVREMASKMLSGVVRCSQRQSIVMLKDHFVSLARKTKIPNRQDPTYAESLRSLHSAILGVCALIESFPYSVERWMPPLTDVLAMHATDPLPISTTIRKCASEFKKTHQDTWHKDQLEFNEDQLQSLSTMLVGTSYSLQVRSAVLPLLSSHVWLAYHLRTLHV